MSELNRQYTTNLLRLVRHYYDQMVDERTGRLFKLHQIHDLPAQSGFKPFAFQISEENYITKSTMILNFVEELHKSTTICVSFEFLNN